MCQVKISRDHEHMMISDYTIISHEGEPWCNSKVILPCDLDVASSNLIQMQIWEVCFWIQLDCCRLFIFLLNFLADMLYYFAGIPFDRQSRVGTS